MRKSEIFAMAIFLLSLVIAVSFYPQMPEQMASHWNAQGKVDDYMSKFWGLFLFPLIFLSLALMLIAIPRIDPLRKNIEAFREYFDGFIIIFSIFMFLIYTFTILWNLGIKISINNVIPIPIPIGLLFFYIGILCEKAKRNWFIGIRTPWTLSSDKVWGKTHHLGGKLFKITGIIAMFGIFFPNQSVYLVLIPVLSVAIYLVVFSYFEYEKEVKENNTNIM